MKKLLLSLILLGTLSGQINDKNFSDKVGDGVGLAGPGTGLDQSGTRLQAKLPQIQKLSAAH